MIFLVHGDNTALSRKLIINQFNNKELKNKKEVHINDISVGNLTEVILSQDLFGDPQFLILDITGAKPQTLEEALPVIKSVPEKNVMIVYSSKPLPKANILLKYAVESEIKIVENTITPEGNIFRFVDLLISQKRESAYKELSNLLKDGNDPFYLFSMIIYGLRNTTHAVLNSDKFKQMKPFQKGTLEPRAKKTTLPAIKETVKYMYQLDKKTKIGELAPEMMLTLGAEKMLNF